MLITLKLEAIENDRNEMSNLPFEVKGKLKKLLIGADIIKNKNYSEIEYLVEELIPKGTLCALVGESDTGKSSLLRQLAVSLVYGDDKFLGFKLNDSCRNVVYVSTEDGEMATSVWLNTYFGRDSAEDEKLSKLKFIYSVDGIAKNLTEVVSNNCVDLIIVDSYADLFNGSMNNSNEVRSFLNLYDSIVKRFGVTVVFLHHTKKASAGMVPSKNSILGSQGFEAKMRSVLMLSKDKEDSSLRHLCVVKNNYMPEYNKSESYVLKFNKQLSFENTGDRVQLNNLADEDWIEEAKRLREEGNSLKDTAEILKKKGVKTSKSSLGRKLN